METEETTLKIVAHTNGCFYGTGWTSIHILNNEGNKTLCGYSTLYSDRWEKVKNPNLKKVDCKRCLKKMKEEN